jgi:DnaJ-class molecular chaperone
VLQDDQKRAQYDRFGHDGLRRRVRRDEHGGHLQPIRRHLRWRLWW